MKKVFEGLQRHCEGLQGIKNSLQKSFEGLQKGKNSRQTFFERVKNVLIS